MDKLMATIVAKTPRLLAGFVASRAGVPLLDQRYQAPQCVSQAISCICGNEYLYVEAARRKELKGTCRQEVIITFVPPLYVSCKQCGRFTLLFDPLIHGWKGEMNTDCESDDVQRLTQCRPNPGKLYVSYSYGDIGKYKTLIESGTANAEDYFDSFSLFVSESSGQTVREILSSKCY